MTRFICGWCDDETYDSRAALDHVHKKHRPLIDVFLLGSFEIVNDARDDDTKQPESSGLNGGTVLHQDDDKAAQDDQGLKKKPRVRRGPAR